MSVDRCPNCNKIISPQERVCSECGAKLDNDSIAKINSIYHTSNISTLIYLGILFIGALLYGFVNWIVAVVVMVVLFAVVIYWKFLKK